MESHTKCLAENFIAHAGEEGNFMIPIFGTCPLCKQELSWGDMVMQKKCSLNRVECGQEEDGNSHEEMSDEF